VEVEEYFQAGRFDGLIRRELWDRFETRVEANTLKVLDLLDRFGTRATFFVLGCLADSHPELVRELTRRGHEVAAMGYEHRTIEQRHLGPDEFRRDLRRCREALERACGRAVVGNRVPHYLGPRDLWALDVLAEEGWLYDSSLKPIFRRFAGERWRLVPHRHERAGHTLWEFPLSAWSVFGLSLPIAGAGYFRHLPHALVSRVVRRWHPRRRAPFLMYFRVWELDPQQPRIDAASRLAKLRHYRNLDKLERVLKYYFRHYSVAGIADHLGLERRPLPQAPPGAEVVELRSGAAPPAQAAAAPPLPVTVVVPCYNEESSLAFLANMLQRLEADFGPRYAARFVFVDDASSDGTWQGLERRFGALPHCSLVRHDRNRGVAGTILTGIRHARTEVVCSIDCDCSYDPAELRRMIPLLSAGVDLVTASPYHPRGLVRNVPGWRLALSRGASFLYRRVLRTRLSTYTSCFRVYRRSAVADLQLQEEGFLGVTEMLGRLDLRGARIVEHPATLEVRIFGHSKMRALRGILGHLKLLSRFVAMRLARGPAGLGARAGSPPAA
jgi:polysaccharide deacetylase family protein (PEP-CTERM system associated)